MNFERPLVTPLHCRSILKLQWLQLANVRRALIGFLLSLFPLSMTLMGWRGAGGLGAASTGFFFFFGGLCMILGGVGEVSILRHNSDGTKLTLKQWILGNTFPFVVFSSFGAFWLSFAATLVPYYNTYEAFKVPNEASSTGLETIGFNVGIGTLQTRKSNANDNR